MSVWDDYTCDEQIELNEWLWDSGYYMPLPEAERETMTVEEELQTVAEQIGKEVTQIMEEEKGKTDG